MAEIERFTRNWSSEDVRLQPRSRYQHVQSLEALALGLSRLSVFWEWECIDMFSRNEETVLYGYKDQALELLRHTTGSKRLPDAYRSELQHDLDRCDELERALAGSLRRNRLVYDETLIQLRISAEDLLIDLGRAKEHIERTALSKINYFWGHVWETSEDQLLIEQVATCGNVLHRIHFLLCAVKTGKEAVHLVEVSQDQLIQICRTYTSSRIPYVDQLRHLENIRADFNRDALLLQEMKAKLWSLCSLFEIHMHLLRNYLFVNEIPLEERERKLEEIDVMTEKLQILDLEDLDENFECCEVMFGAVWAVYKDAIRGVQHQESRER